MLAWVSVALLVLMPSCARDPGAHTRGWAQWCPPGTPPAPSLRGGASSAHPRPLEAEPVNSLLGKRDRASGVSFQAIIDGEGAHRFFNASGLERLRRQFVQPQSGGSADDHVPIGLLGQLRLRIGIRRDKVSRSLVTGEPVSDSQDDGLSHLGWLPEPRAPAQKRQLVENSNAKALGGSVHAAVQSAVEQARKHTQQGENGAPVVDGGVKSVCVLEGIADDLLNYNPSLLHRVVSPSGSNGALSIPSTVQTTEPLHHAPDVGAQHGNEQVALGAEGHERNGQGGDIGLSAIRNTDSAQCASNAVGTGVLQGTQQPAKGRVNERAAGRQGVSGSPDTRANMQGSVDEYIGWVAMPLVPPHGETLEAFEGECELLRSDGQLEVVTEVGVSIGLVSAVHAKPLLAFLRRSVPPATIHCVCKTLREGGTGTRRAAGAQVQLEIVIYGPTKVRAEAERLLLPSGMQTNLAGSTGFVGSTGVRPMEEVGHVADDTGPLVNAVAGTREEQTSLLAREEAEAHAMALQVDREAEQRELQRMLDVRGASWHESVAVDDLFNDGVQHDAMPQLDAPPSVSTRLMLHQRKALYWMVAREEPCKPMFWEPYYNSRTNTRGWFNAVTRAFSRTAPEGARGGILADEMGLGKTLTVISLVMRGVAARRKLLEGGMVPMSNATGPTLIVSPLSVLQNWVDQLREHTDGSLRLYIYHGPGRTREPMSLMLYDVVLTTYSILGSEFIPQAKRDADEAASLLHCIRWSRVVLDEGHQIGNRHSQQSKAVVALSSVARWVVTGTPITNKLEDLFALFAFLRLHPLDNFDYFQKLGVWFLRQSFEGVGVRGQGARERCKDSGVRSEGWGVRGMGWG
jgi:hypothetical protein